MSGICETCDDDRFELIAKAKQKLLDDTNISSRADELAVLDDILFRCWQMGWLDPERTCKPELPTFNGFPIVNGQPHCSACKAEFTVGAFPNYCPNCGAKVIGDAE